MKKKNPDLFKMKSTPDHPCLKCKVVLKASMLVGVFEIDSHLAPVLKVSLCRHCGHLAIYDLKRNQLRPPTKAELKEIKGDPETWGMVKQSRALFEVCDRIANAKFN